MDSYIQKRNYSLNTKHLINIYVLIVDFQLHMILGISVESGKNNSLHARREERKKMHCPLY